MATSNHSTHTTSDHLEVYQRTWIPAEEAKAHLIFLHGFSDRIDHYDAFFTVLTSKYPIRVWSWDRRGWGKTVHSRGDRGNTGPMDKQIFDVNEYINYIFMRIPDVKATPLFLMGHSMGGQEATYYMLHQQTIKDDARPHFSGLILESPYIGLDAASAPSHLKVIAGRLAARLLPTFQIPNPIPAEYLSPDKAVQVMYSEDPLCHNLGTLECFRDMLERSEELGKLAHNPGTPPHQLKNKLPVPTLWTHGTADKATDYVVSKALCNALQSCGNTENDKVFKSYEGWYHQLHNMPDGKQEQYAKDVGEWVMSIVG